MNLMAQAQPGAVLVIYRDFIKPGNAAAYRTIERDTARLMREAAPFYSEQAVRFPNAYLAAEPLTGLQEIWFLTMWKSQRDYEKVKKDYSQAPKLLVEALTANSKIRAELTLPPMSAITTYCGDISSGQPWKIGRDRYLVIATTKTRSRFPGSVYEAEDQTYYVIRSAKSRPLAEELVASSGLEARGFEVRPDLSRPATEWVAADQELWSHANMAK